MDYEDLRIARYTLWDLYLHQSQFPYLGRCYASARREEADLVTDMNRAESVQLFEELIPDWKRAIENLFGKIRPNVAILGNEWNHLHAHLIPRFEGVREFDNIGFVDPRPKGNYVPYPKKQVKDATLIKIKDLIANKIC